MSEQEIIAAADMIRRTPIRETVWTRTRRAFRDHGADVDEACRLYAQWSGLAPHRLRLAHYVGCGLSANGAAARELAYVLSLSFNRFLRVHRGEPIGM